MNWQHLRAFFWLQWRLRINQFKRGGTANLVILAILAVGGVLLTAVLAVVSFVIGAWPMAEASPVVLMLVWDGVAAAFLFFWMIGLVADLQRAEALSLTKFLHLPVSLSGVFLLNYLSSLMSFNLFMFAPIMVWLSIGLVYSHGAGMLMLLPLVAAFLLMVTALTYQFQGWLASLMTNKRRRRTIIVVVTTVFVLIAQLPNLINFMKPWAPAGPDPKAAEFTNQVNELTRDLTAKKITLQEFQQRQAELNQKQPAEREASNRRTWEKVESTAQIINLCLPPGWLPLGAAAAGEGNPWSLLAVAGMTLIGAASLWRGYRTTVRLYTGHYTAGAVQAAAPVPAPAATAEPAGAKPNAGLLTMNLPWISEQAAAVALSGFRSLTRAPEVKMIMLTPVILAVVFGAMVLRHSIDPPDALRPLMAFGGIAMILLTTVQLTGNQFGFDRSGFRVFVLCPARRADILIGKNCAVAPIALALGMLAIAFVQVVYPMRLDHFAAMFPLLVSVYLVFCVIANCLSLLAPMPIASGSLKPKQAKLVPVLLHLAFVFVFPTAMGPCLAPLGLEVLLEMLDLVSGWPIFLALSILQCVGLSYAYRWLVGWQGVWLQAKEQRIMEIVTAKAE